MHYLVGLERLGYEAWYVEDHGANPYDPRVNSVVMDCAYNVDYLRRVMERYGLGGRWAYWDAINDVYHGLSPRAGRARSTASADALINLCGATRLRDEHMACPVRIMVDTDPVYEQIKYAKADRAARAYLDAHTHFFTYGENVGGPGWIVPLCGMPWRPTRPPVVLELWPDGRGQAGLLHHHRHLGEQGQEHRLRRRDLSSGRSTSISCASSICRAHARDVLRHGDAAARRRRRRGWCAARAGASPIRARSRPT